MPDVNFEVTLENRPKGPLVASGREAHVELTVTGEESSDLLTLLAAAGDEIQRLLGAAAVALATTGAQTVKVTAPAPDEELEEAPAP